MNFRQYLYALMGFGVKKPVRHYPRSVCLVCGGTFALTSKGAWRHKCAVSRPKSAA